MRPGFSRLIDIGIIRVENGIEVARYQTLLNPHVPISGMISQMTGIRDEDVARAPTFDEEALRIQELLEGAVFVAHMASFDYGFMKAEFGRLGMEFAAQTLCSVRLSKALYPQGRGHSLDKVIERCNLSCEARHRALPDADVVLQFFQHSARHFPESTIERAVKYVLGGSASLVHDKLTHLPDSAGVYMMYGPEQELLYVGKSKNIRTRARSHFHVSDRGSELQLQAHAASVEAIPTSGELSALLLEATLIKREMPLYNRALRKKKMLVIARRTQDAQGYDRIALERTGELSADGSVMSVFRSQVQGKGVLRELAKEHRICEVMLGIENSKGSCFGLQLGTCDGACTGVLPSIAHNARIDEAFRSRRIRTWPYRGPVLITERESEDAGTVFFFDNWVLFGAYRYEGDAISELLGAAEGFEYDSYKILARFLRNKQNRRLVRPVTNAEFTRELERCRA